MIWWLDWLDNNTHHSHLSYGDIGRLLRMNLNTNDFLKIQGTMTPIYASTDISIQIYRQSAIIDSNRKYLSSAYLSPTPLSYLYRDIVPPVVSIFVLNLLSQVINYQCIHLCLQLASSPYFHHRLLRSSSVRSF